MNTMNTAWFWIKTCTATLTLLLAFAYLPWLFQGALAPL